MKEITALDIQPSVFKVILMCTDHTEGFTAIADFRKGQNETGVTQVFMEGAGALAVLTALRDDLTRRFGKCHTCQNYRNISS